VLFTIHIPFALAQIQHLGLASPEVVTNVFHLCSLTEIVMDYEASMDQINEYFSHLCAYRKGLQLLRKDLKGTPNQHMAFHIPFQHHNYGPSAYLAAWQFEQYNGILQRTPNNKKICMYLSF
jgi:hypothetical protein